MSDYTERNYLSRMDSDDGPVRTRIQACWHRCWHCPAWLVHEGSPKNCPIKGKTLCLNCSTKELLARLETQELMERLEASERELDDALREIAEGGDKCAA